MFSREIESDLSQYHGRDIGDWHIGVLTSRKLMVYLDGLPSESWYKVSLKSLHEKFKKDEERQQRVDVRSLIFAQLHGQEMTKNA